MVQMLHPLAGDAHDAEDVRELLLERLTGKRVLLVLDGVTDVSDAQWRDLMEVLQQAARTSLIMVTTRSESAATVVGTMPPLILSPLAFDDYWKMFKHFAFGSADESEDCTPLGDDWEDLEEEEEELSPMEQIAYEIAKKLGCSPLPARLIGRSLYFRQGEEGHWRNVLDDTLWEQQHITGISPALWLSYQHLDPRLKQCFAYCAVFPDDYVFRKEELEQMWIAHGLIYSDDRAARLEDVAHGLFDELAERCFFQPLGRNRYVIHSMMQKLSQAVSGSQFYMVTESSGEVPQEVRHLTIRTNNLMKLKMDLALQLSPSSDHHFLQRVRTLLFCKDFSDSDEFLEVLAEIFSVAKGVRVLSLSCANIAFLPAEIGLLRHLRYLNLSRNSITELPETVCQLHLLQVLDVKCNSGYLNPPNGTSNLIQLRHLYASALFLSGIPGIQNLSNLQELEALSVGSSTQLTALRQMMQLRGALHIENLRQCDVSEFKKGILKGMKHLNKLHLSWANSMGKAKEIYIDEEVLECLQPHENVKVLKITGYTGIKSPSWMLKTSCSLSNTTSMYLSDCMNWESLPPLHDMPCLEVLEIRKMHSVKQIGVVPQRSDTELFPKLKRLVIEDALHFTGWSRGNSTTNVAFPCLCKLEIRNCPDLTTFPDVPLTLTIMIIENVGLHLLPMIHEKQLSEEEAVSTSEEGRWTSRLTTLQIHHCHNLKSLGSGLLQQQHLLRSLEVLSIKSCDNVICDLSDGFKDLTALRDLSLYDCPKLLVDKFHSSLRILEISECFIAQGGWVDEYPFLFSLWTLKISSCSHVSADQGSKIEPLDWLSSLFNVYNLQLENTFFVRLSMFDKLNSLEILEIDGSRAFFDGSLDFEWLEKLHTLNIRNCTELCELPENLYTLPALEELCVENCPAIQALPANGLPASLKRFSIYNCSPQLTQRCLDDELDRAKIAKIGIVYIGGQSIITPEE
jgi:Leucine-rich repeat (LRR) protein